MRPGAEKLLGGNGLVAMLGIAYWSCGLPAGVIMDV